MWKVFNIQSGKVTKLGFSNEEAGRAWLDRYRDGRQENYDLEEMDPDELAEWDARKAEGEELIEPVDLETDVEDDEDDAYEKKRYSYSTEDDEAHAIEPDELDGFSQNDGEEDDF